MKSLKRSVILTASVSAALILSGANSKPLTNMNVPKKSIAPAPANPPVNPQAKLPAKNLYDQGTATLTNANGKQISRFQFNTRFETSADLKTITRTFIIKGTRKDGKPVRTIYVFVYKRSAQPNTYTETITLLGKAQPSSGILVALGSDGRWTKWSIRRANRCSPDLVAAGFCGPEESEKISFFDKALVSVIERTDQNKKLVSRLTLNSKVISAEDFKKHATH
jgi:hypothetical protein